ncbi:LytTR family transcriptional regulator DNA-binding domain-containing protein [Paenibacillus elgii]|uniref:LytTR family transcriptional regulator DNA-binding domain-containing protein n=1 Tax=Paenibacillus elgii TaxID=189691 RepID=UPI000248D3A6|nr:LytTR family transcriptional regulator DNA-binding domain-containing protein [Paenibacillus elgii]
MNITLPCAKSNGEEISVNIEDIYYVIQSDNKKEIIQFVTENDHLTFRLRGSIETILSFLEQFGFTELNNGIVVNIGRVKYFNNKLGLAYFDKNIHAQVSRRNLYKVEHLLKKE